MATSLITEPEQGKLEALDEPSLEIKVLLGR